MTGFPVEQVAQGDPAKAVLAVAVIVFGWAVLELVVKYWQR